MTKRKNRRGASFGLRWSVLKESMNVALAFMWAGKMPRPKRKAKTTKKRVPIDASKGRKRLPKTQVVIPGEAFCK